MQAFLNFIREQGIIGLAIGFILGGAVGKVVSSLVSDIIQPIIGLIFGSPEGLRVMVLGPIRLGNFFVVLIDFLIVATVVYFIFKKLKLDKFDKKAE
ncbi:MAG: MscL family protein [Patescibacteria group bacterium]